MINPQVYLFCSPPFNLLYKIYCYNLHLCCWFRVQYCLLNYNFLINSLSFFEGLSSFQSQEINFNHHHQLNCPPKFNYCFKNFNHLNLFSKIVRFKFFQIKGQIE